jgi:hypothetical protein
LMEGLIWILSCRSFAHKGYSIVLRYVFTTRVGMTLYCTGGPYSAEI